MKYYGPYRDYYYEGPDVYRVRDSYKERADDLEELCGELLTELSAV